MGRCAVSEVAFERLSLHLSGVSPERARALAQLVARALAAGAPSLRAGRVQQANAAVQAAPEEPDDQVAERVARAILRELGGV